MNVVMSSSFRRGDIATNALVAIMLHIASRPFLSASLNNSIVGPLRCLIITSAFSERAQNCNDAITQQIIYSFVFANRHEGSNMNPFTADPVKALHFAILV